jgi:hypothetical protein
MPKGVGHVRERGIAGRLRKGTRPSWRKNRVRYEAPSVPEHKSEPALRGDRYFFGNPLVLRTPCRYTDTLTDRARDGRDESFFLARRGPGVVRDHQGGQVRGRARVGRPTSLPGRGRDAGGARRLAPRKISARPVEALALLRGRRRAGPLVAAGGDPLGCLPDEHDSRLLFVVRLAPRDRMPQRARIAPDLVHDRRDRLLACDGPGLDPVLEDVCARDDRGRLRAAPPHRLPFPGRTLGAAGARATSPTAAVCGIDQPSSTTDFVAFNDN